MLEKDRLGKMNDNEIYIGIMKRDEKIFQLFINKHIKLYYKIIMDTLSFYSNEEDIKDCLSEAMIYLWFHIEQFNSEKSSLLNWTCLVVYSRAMNKRSALARSAKKTERLEEQLLFEKSPVLTPEEIYLQREARESVYAAINELINPLQRDIVKRRFVQNQKPKQIAECLGISIKQVDNYLYNAKKILRKRRHSFE